MKYFSMFSGIGGFEYGIERACMGVESTDEKSEQTEPEILERWQRTSMEEGLCVLPSDNRRLRAICVGFSEIDKYAKQIYKKHFGGHKDYGDCTKIRWEEVEDFDCLVGGVPCQAWSIAGKRKGFEDARGTMWFEYFRCLKEKQPKFFVAENVKGILSHNKGNSFEEICRCFCELGYAIDFEVLNSKNFGVPQNRERVFIVGVRLDLLDKCQIF